MDHLLLLLGGQRRPDGVELDKRAAEIVCVDAVLVTGLPLRSQFRQAVFSGFDLLLNADNPVEPRAGQLTRLLQHAECQTGTQLTKRAPLDVFSSEIVRFVKPDGVPRVEEVAFPTFGADPGRILLHVFGSTDTIGSRAAEFLREKLKKEWKQEDRAELERLVNEIGSGWPRAKLAEILAKLDAPPRP